jgi:predicted  nucleic acid-binding Zn-ribbon protein
MKDADWEIPTTDESLLLELQQADFRILKLKKHLEQLPQRRQILDLRAKRQDVESKLAQISMLREQADQAMRLYAEQEAAAQQRTRDAQKRMDESPDYKEAAALSREIEASAKKLADAQAGSFAQLEKLDKIAAVEQQALQMRAQLERQESEATEDFKAQGGTLKSAIAYEEQKRSSFAERLPMAILSRYEKAASARGGIGVATVEDGHCSACRVSFNEGQLIAFRAGDSISSCPHCHRLLIAHES